MRIETLVPSVSMHCVLGVLIVNSFVNLNTGFYEDMKLSKNRLQMFIIYYKTHFFADLTSIVSIFALLILE